MSDYRKTIGRLGEERAARLLEKAGCRVVGRNYRTRFGEIDLIGREGEAVIFIEVKTRTSDAFGPAGASVGARKQSRMIKASAEYMQEMNLTDVPVRFDVVTIEVRGDEVVTEHIRDAFEAYE